MPLRCENATKCKVPKRRTFNPGVLGSSPRRPTRQKGRPEGLELACFAISRQNRMVERTLADINIMRVARVGAKRRKAKR